MFGLTLRSLRAEGLRLLLSSLAVLLGVAFITGTLMVTDGMRASAYDRAGIFDRNTDVGVYPDHPSIGPDTVDTIRGVAGVAAAEGELTGTGGLVGVGGKPVLGLTVLASIPVDPRLRSYDLTAGRLPDRPGEVVLDAATVAAQRFALDTPVRVGGVEGAATPYRLVGVVDVAGTSRDLGGPFIGLVGVDALRVTGERGYGRVLVAGQPGESDAELAVRVGAAVGSTFDVLTHRQIVDRELVAAVRDVTQFNLVLLLFGAVSVLVAAFVIANTFTIVLAQRTRRTALLRLVGATRGQVFRSALLESAVTGLLASLLGVGAGAAVAAGMRAVSGAFFDTLPGAVGSLSRTELPLHGSTVALAVGLGTVITVGSALVPAWRGTQVPPVAALSAAAVLTASPAGRGRLGLGAVALAAGVAALSLPGVTGSALAVAAGGVLSFAGIMLLGPMLVPALIRVLGWPSRRLLGAVAGLAVANAIRNPRRIAATATALVLGIGLVSAFMVGAQSAKAGLERSVDNQLGADYLITSLGAHLPARLIDDLRARPEVGIAHERRRAETGGVQVISSEASLVAPMLHRVVEGDVSRLGPGTMLVHRQLAQERGLTLGSSMPVAGRPLRMVAVVEYADPVLGGDTDDSGGSGGASVILSGADFSALFPGERGYLAELMPASGVSDHLVRAAVEAVVDNYPTVTFLDHAGYKRMLTGTVDTLLVFVTALLGLAVVIALVGVANTLTLSVLERTRENAVLRAVGLTRGRLRAMLAIEAVLSAMVGALLGVGLGIGVSAGAMGFLNQLGGDFTLVLPLGRLGLLLAVAACAALAASVLPARRAVRRSVVEALGAG